MNDPHLLTACFALVYALCAGIDGVWLHLWRYRLHVHARREHGVHTLRAILFPGVVALLFMGWTTGFLLWCGTTLAVVDLVVVAFDAAMETHTRTFQHGLPPGEAALHTVLQALHAVVLTCAIAVRPWSAWTIHPTFESGPGTLATMIFLGILFGSVIIAVVHVYLYAKAPSPERQCVTGIS